MGKRRFHFKAFWHKCPGFLEVVERAWHWPLRNANPMCNLDWLLRNAARFLQSWSDRSVDNVQLQLAIAKEVVCRLEMVRDRQPLAAHVESLHKKLKLMSLALSSLQCTITRQESWLL
jgi:hypothetical protein